MNQPLTKREKADGLVRVLLPTPGARVLVAEAVAEALRIGVSRRTLQRAAAAAGVREIHNGRETGIWTRA